MIKVGVKKGLLVMGALAVCLSASAAESNTYNQAAIDKILGEVQTQSKPAPQAATSTVPLTVKQQVAASDKAAFASTDSEVDRLAFDKVLKTQNPLTPEQIKTLHYSLDQSRRAAAVSPTGQPARPTSSSVVVNLATGTTPPVIRLGAGFVTSVNFLDSTGQPWPIKAYDLGSPQAFNIHWDQKSNMLLIQAVASYMIGNLAVQLKGLNTPVMITLIPGQTALDYRVDMRVPKLGPNAAPVLVNMPQTSDSRLLGALDGIAPTSSKSLQVDGGGDTQVWMGQKFMFLRTRLTLLSPSWLATVNSADGMHAYKLTPASVLLTMDHGKITKLTVKGF